MLSSTKRISAISMRSTSDPALDRLLDDLFGGLRLGLLVARQIAAKHMDEFVDESDQQNDQPCRVTDLRNPHRNRDHALRHLVEAPGIPDQLAGVEREEADEADADNEADQFD